MQLCSICGNKYEDICGNCISVQETCVLCFTTFEENDTVIQCNECFYLGHEENFSSWLNKNGSCPACRAEYQEENFKEIILKEGTIQELYLEKSSVYFKRKSIFDDFSFHLPYYNFQEYVLNDMLDQLQFDDSHLLISPPGSGKTIIGLSIASHFAVNTLVLTPNLAVLGSWIDRLEMFYDEKSSDLALTDIYTRSTGDVKPLTISTYQQVNSSLREISKRTKPKKKKGSKIPISFVERLAHHEIGLVILDEAHRLTGQWGRDVAKLLEHLGEVKIVGLTATPPQESSETFEAVFKDRKTEIPLPMLVREAVLAPYRDFSIQLPSKQQLRNLKSKAQSDEFKSLNNGSYLSKIIERTLKEVDYVNEFLSDELYINSPGEIPYTIRWLSSNLSILTYLSIEVILKEIENMGDNFRGLVLLEQENLPSKYPHKFKGIGGAIGIFEDLLMIDEINLIDPIFVTGNSLLVDADFTEMFEELGDKWIEENNLDMNFRISSTRKNYVIIKGRGSDWNTDTYTRYVTFLFEQGYTKLLVGTRFLLGEGWDSQSLNTVIDLTTFSSYAFVNQVKGRALRKNPALDNKVSNLWEFAPNPSLTALSEKEFENYEKRHDIYFGIDDDGRIRNGIDRLNPTKFITDKDKTRFSEIEYTEFIQNTIKLSQNRDQTYKLWKVGEKLGDLYHVIRFEINLPSIINQDLGINRKLMSRIKNYIHSLVSFSLNSLFNGDKFESITIRYDQFNDLKLPVRFLIPIETDFDIVQEIQEALKPARRTQFISLESTLYKYDYHPLVAKIRDIINLEIKSKSISFMINAPWNLEVLSENEIIGSNRARPHTIRTLDSDLPSKLLDDNTVPNLIQRTRYRHNASSYSLIQRHLQQKSDHKMNIEFYKQYDLYVTNILVEQEFINR